nr:hypothetical protein [Spirochaetaceae bacterium]
NTNQDNANQDNANQDNANQDNANQDNISSAHSLDSDETLVEKPLILDENFLDEFHIEGIYITMADIHLRANGIAVANGYRDLGFHEVTGDDPAIIYPGEILQIPDSGTYTVSVDDNIWYIAATLLEQELRRDLRTFEASKEKWENSSELEKNQIISTLDGIIANTYCKNLAEHIGHWVESNR